MSPHPQRVPKTHVLLLVEKRPLIDKISKFCADVIHAHIDSCACAKSDNDEEKMTKTMYGIPNETVGIGSLFNAGSLFDVGMPYCSDSTENCSVSTQELY